MIILIEKAWLIHSMAHCHQLKTYNHLHIIHNQMEVMACSHHQVSLIIIQDFHQEECNPHSCHLPTTSSCPSINHSNNLLLISQVLQAAHTQVSWHLLAITLAISSNSLLQCTGHLLTTTHSSILMPNLKIPHHSQHPQWTILTISKRS